MTSLYLCDSCAPEGLSAEEYCTRPLAEKCLVCGTEATRWYVRAESVLKGLLKERKETREWIAAHAQHDESNGPCYGRRFAAPDPDQSAHMCRCGLNRLQKALGIGT